MKFNSTYFHIRAISEIFSNDFQPAKVNMANDDIVTDVPACAATVFWTNLKLV